MPTAADAGVSDGLESVVDEPSVESVESVVSSDGVVVVVVVVVVGVVVGLSASIATAGFKRELNCVTCCGVPNPGAPKADSSCS